MIHEAFSSLFPDLPQHEGNIPPPAQVETSLLNVNQDTIEAITSHLSVNEKLSLIENSFRVSAGSQTAQTLYSCYLARLARIHPSFGPKLLWSFYTSLTKTQKLALLHSAHQTHPDNVEIETSKDIPLDRLLAPNHKNPFRKHFIRTLSRQFPGDTHFQDLTHNFISPPNLTKLLTYLKKELENNRPPGRDITAVCSLLGLYNHRYWFQKLPQIARTQLTDRGQRLLQQAGSTTIMG